jgi:hypothetical protein
MAMQPVQGNFMVGTIALLTYRNLFGDDRHDILIGYWMCHTHSLWKMPRTRTPDQSVPEMVLDCTVNLIADVLDGCALPNNQGFREIRVHSFSESKLVCNINTSIAWNDLTALCRCVAILVLSSIALQHLVPQDRVRSSWLLCVVLAQVCQCVQYRCCQFCCKRRDCKISDMQDWRIVGRLPLDICPVILHNHINKVINGG